MLPKGYNLGGKVLERPPLVRKVAGAISDRVIPNTLKMVSITIDVLVSGYNYQIYLSISHEMPLYNWLNVEIGLKHHTNTTIKATKKEMQEY